MYVQGLGARSDHRTRLSMVRFGNVLGSASSVLPIWASQIAEGGPVTVTDERMTRYFMTIPEAAGLVIHAASMSSPARAEVFVLDMGRPIPIIDMARRFIAAHGLTAVDEDPARAPAWEEIAIRITGARPGEKLHEELAYHAESLRPTAHPAIGALSEPDAPDAATIAAMIEHLDRARDDASAPAVVGAISRFVPQLRAVRVAA
jgi:FlaA1/EpsC-like NDP-sugar epimerase